jgi:8-amino-7-oxononanoate synthase
VVVDGVYSMGGDLAPLRDVVAVCRRFGAQLLVDDAHGAGVMGGGRGTCAHFGATADVDLITVTFSKSFASIGGAVMADEDVIHYLRHHARSEIFSASMTPASTAAALTALRVAREEPWRAEQALANARFVRSRLRQLGYSVGESSSPIVPVHLQDEFETVALWRQLLDLGVYTNAVVPPAGSYRLRLSFSAGHTPAQLDRVVSAFADAADLLPDAEATLLSAGRVAESAA